MLNISYLLNLGPFSCLKKHIVASFALTHLPEFWQPDWQQLGQITPDELHAKGSNEFPCWSITYHIVYTPIHSENLSFLSFVNQLAPCGTQAVCLLTWEALLPGNLPCHLPVCLSLVEGNSPAWSSCLCGTLPVNSPTHHLDSSLSSLHQTLPWNL